MVSVVMMAQNAMNIALSLCQLLATTETMDFPLLLSNTRDIYSTRYNGLTPIARLGMVSIWSIVILLFLAKERDI